MALPRRQLRSLHLFAGAGGGILGDILLGHLPVCAVEIDAYCRAVLLARQKDGCLPRFPIWDDVRTFEGREWRGAVDIVAGGFPCQDISAAGRGAGIDGARSGLWVEMARIIGEVRPRFAFVENSPVLTSRGLGRVLGDLAEMGMDARWGVFAASDAGAPHLRERIWIVADADKNGCLWKRGDRRMARSSALRRWSETQYGSSPVSNTPWPPRPERVCDIPRATDGLAVRVDRLASIGNGQVSSVAALAWRTLTEGLTE